MALSPETSIVISLAAAFLAICTMSIYIRLVRQKIRPKTYITTTRNPIIWLITWPYHLYRFSQRLMSHQLDNDRPPKDIEKGAPYTIRAPQPWMQAQTHHPLPDPSLFAHLDELSALRAALMPPVPVRQQPRSQSSQSDESFLTPVVPALYSSTPISTSTSSTLNSQVASPARVVTRSEPISPYRSQRQQQVGDLSRYYATMKSEGRGRPGARTVSPLRERLEFDSMFAVDSLRGSASR